MATRFPLQSRLTTLFALCVFSALSIGACGADTDEPGSELPLADPSDAGESDSGDNNESDLNLINENDSGDAGESEPGDAGGSDSGGDTGTTVGNFGPDLDGTTLKQIADGMEEGTFYRLEDGPNDPELPEGYDSYSSVQMRGTFHSSAESWSPVAEWCPIVRRVYQIADRSGNGVDYDRTAISGYDANTHSWIRHNLHPDSDIQKILGGPHVYGGWALACERGKLYRPKGTTMWEYDLQQETWSSRDWAGFEVAGQTPVVFHPDIDRLVAIAANGDVLAWDPTNNAVDTLSGGNPAQTGRHGHAVYNARRQEVMLWAGDNGRQVTLVQADGSATAMNATPSDVLEESTSSGLFLAYDPLSGNYLSFAGRQLYEYNPELDEWRFVIDLSSGTDGFPPFHGYLLTPIPEAGVIMWNHRASPRLYKHKSVF